MTFDLISFNESRNFFCSFSKSKFIKISLTDSAPIPAVKASSPNSSWALMRASNTSPKLVLRFEGDTEDNLNQIKT